MIEEELFAKNASSMVAGKRAAFEAHRELPQYAFASSDKMQAVRDVALQVAQGQRTDDHLAAACVPVVKAFKDAIPALSDPAFEGKARIAAQFLVPWFYIDAVQSLAAS